MEDRFEELIGFWVHTFELIHKLLLRSGIEIAAPDAQIIGITRPAVIRALGHLDAEPTVPEAAKTAITTVIVKWLLVGETLDKFEDDPAEWRDLGIQGLLGEAEIAGRIAWHELDKRDLSN